MHKISLVPDTNVLISNLDVIQQIHSHGFAFMCTLNISRIVLGELDYQKARSKPARDAIKFIDAVADSLRVELEGRVDDRKIDVEVAYREGVDARNNDDKILNYALTLENPILLTNDVSFALKCSAHNVQTINLNKYKAEDAIAMISERLAYALSTPTYSAAPAPAPSPVPAPALAQPAMQSPDDDTLPRLMEGLKNTLEPTVHRILLARLGPGYYAHMPGAPSLVYYLELVLQNFSYFEPYFPAATCPVIVRLLAAISKNDLKAAEKYAKVIFTVCGRIPG
ncbi:hypothetical protein PAPHI01_0596 [Pancytospora philotis]|nr:hypothetical protein PAPHI01_0596 [Pancytospora philotis]